MTDVHPDGTAGLPPDATNDATRTSPVATVGLVMVYVPTPALAVVERCAIATG